MKRFLLLDNNLYILLKTNFKKERKEKGKRKETKTIKNIESLTESQAVKTIKLYHAVNMRGKMLNVIKTLAILYSKI